MATPKKKKHQKPKAPPVPKPMTFGEKLVGLEFNPSGDERVTKVKKHFAEVADLLNENFNNERGERALYDVIFKDAVMQLLSAQMMAVKMLTFKY